MAGNFWRSSHSQQWIMDRQDLIRERNQDLAFITEDEYQKVIIFYCGFMQTLGEHLKLRQQVVATAIVYFKRFYARNSLKCVDPLLLAPTAIFLASKVEEYGVISQSRLVSTCHQILKNRYHYALGQEYPYRVPQILECEFYLLENMDCCLIVYQPYRPLILYIQDLGHEDQLLPAAWKIVNDSLRTDCCLLYAPHQIALASLLMACVAMQKDCKHWFSELNVSMEKLQEICRHILCYYDLIKGFDEKKDISAILNKMPKPKMQPSRPPSSSQSSQEANSVANSQDQNVQQNIVS